MKISKYIEAVCTTKDTVRHYEELGILNPIRSIPVRSIFGDLKTKKPSCMMLEWSTGKLTRTSTERTSNNEF